MRQLNCCGYNYVIYFFEVYVLTLSRERTVDFLVQIVDLRFKTLEFFVNGQDEFELASYKMGIRRNIFGDILDAAVQLFLEV